MTAESEQYKNVCKGEFQSIHTKLDRLDEAIRGNGRLGILRRLDRLESTESFRARALWIAFGAFLACSGAIVPAIIRIP